VERFGLAGVSEEALRACRWHGNETRVSGQRYNGENNLAIGIEFGGIAGTNMSYVTQKMKGCLSGDSQLKE